MHGQTGHVAAVQDDLALATAYQADDHVKGRRLTGAVGAQKPDHFTTFNGDGKVLYDLACSVTLGYAEGLEPVHGESASSAGGKMVMTTGSPHSDEPDVIFFSSMS